MERADGEVGFGQPRVDTGVVPAIIGRGVLLDVASVQGTDCLAESYAITAEDLRAAYEFGSVDPAPGDIVLIRTGRMSRWPSTDAFLSSPPGLGLEAAQGLCEEVGAMTIGLDVGGEALPPADPDAFLPVHAYLGATAGAMVIENLWLEELADRRIFEFALIAAPLKLAGSTGAPVRPLAIPIR